MNAMALFTTRYMDATVAQLRADGFMGSLARFAWLT
jgi:hypothetical protein